MLPATTEPAAAELAPGNSPAAATDEASDRVALFAELQQIRTLAEKYLEQVTKEEKAFEASHSILRVVLQQLQPQGERQPQHADGDEDAGLPPAATRGPAAASVQKDTVAELKETVAELKETVAELKETLKEPLDASLDAFICPITHEIIADPVIDTWRATLTSAPPS
jgi:uncharacterized coiled-coil protein SlyX